MSWAKLKLTVKTSPWQRLRTTLKLAIILSWRKMIVTTKLMQWAYAISPFSLKKSITFITMSKISKESFLWTWTYIKEIMNMIGTKSALRLKILTKNLIAIPIPIPPILTFNSVMVKSKFKKNQISQYLLHLQKIKKQIIFGRRW